MLGARYSGREARNENPMFGRARRDGALWRACDRSGAGARLSGDHLGRDHGVPTGSSGRARQVLRTPTATLDELEMHVTWLPAGQTTHAPHTHPNEEVIVIREGTLEAFQNGKRTRVGPGGVLFMASNQPHNVVNVGERTAVYHVINWHSPGMLKTRAATSPQDAVKAFYGDWSQATATRGAEGYASFFAEDAVLLPPNAAPVSGRAAIRDWQERSQKDATYARARGRSARTSSR